MSAIKTELAPTDSVHVPHAPTAAIPKSTVWDAIEYVRSTLAASIALTLYTADDARSIAMGARGLAREVQRQREHDNAQAVLNAQVFG